MSDDRSQPSPPSDEAFLNVPLIFPFPFDIECAILDQVSDDFCALQACSVVCHEWWIITRRHLFRSVCVDLERGEAEGPGLVGKRSQGPHELKRFLGFLDDNPDVASFVLDVTVRGGGCSLPSLGGFIPAVLSKAPRLRTIALFSLTLGGGNVSEMPTLDLPFQGGESFPCPAIDTLDISRCDFHGPKDFFGILRHFSRIRRLGMYLSHDMSSPYDFTVLDDLRPSTIPLIESVMLDVTKFSPLPPSLLSVLRASSLPNGTLKTIQCIMSSETLGDFLLPCLQGACAHLRELHLDINSNRFLIEVVGFRFWIRNHLRPCLASCTVLESITFAITGRRFRHTAHNFYMQSLQAIFWTCIHLMLPLPPSVHSVVFRVCASFEPDAMQDAVEAIITNREEWGLLDAGLCDHQSLSRVAFVFENDDGHPGDMAEEDSARIVDTLEGLLPNMLAKGVLQVELTAAENPRWV